MSLLDAPAYDEVGERRKSVLIYGSAALICVLFIGGWLMAGTPVDWPWNWWAHLRGRATANAFLKSVEANDLQKAYGIWIHDADWQKHGQNGIYPFARFQQDWSPNGQGNDFGAIHSHKIVAARVAGNVLLMGLRFNNVRSETMTITYDPKTRALSFSPVELYMGD